MKLVIIGGVAGGASAATKARRMDENAEIIMFEKGPYISFANCGLPYYISGEIDKKNKLILQTPEAFKKRFNIDVFVNHEVINIDRNNQTIMVKHEDKTFETSYDKLIIATGTTGLMPPIKGLDATNVFTLRTVPDAEKVFDYIESKAPVKAIVLGGGYIGIETAEALHRRGMDVTIVELFPQVLTLFDPDMVEFIHSHIIETGVKLELENPVKEIIKDENGKATTVILKSGKKLEAHLIISSLGVRPNTELAKNAGIETVESGAIKVNERMETSDPYIYAAGDAVQPFNFITKKWSWYPLAGPANKQGRVAGANAAGGDLVFKGVAGTAIVRFNKLVAGKTGLSEKEAKREGYDYFVTTTNSMSHAGYYHGGKMLHIKIIADKKSGKLLGAQVIGEDGVDKRIDVFATALYFGANVEDLANLDLAYAPPFGSAKDPVNISGMTAYNRFSGIEDSITYDDFLSDKMKYNIIDVRTPGEYKDGALENSTLIPVDSFREYIDNIPQDKDIVVYCKAGYRGYLTQRILKQKGFNVKNLDGGYFMVR